MMLSHRQIWGLAVVGLATACHPVEHMHHGTILSIHPAYVGVLDRLDCPERQGGLTRTAAAADGRSCRYSGSDDEDVAISLLNLNGASPAQALAPIEADLQAVVPLPAQAHKPSSAGESGDHTRIDLPGLHIDADGDQADVKLPGVSLQANNDQASIHTGAGDIDGADITADHGSAVIRAGSVDDRGADLTYLLESDKPGSSGVRAGGYIARGPKAGPLVVATFKTKSSHHDDRDDVSRLVDLDLRH